MVGVLIVLDFGVSHSLEHCPRWAFSAEEPGSGSCWHLETWLPQEIVETVGPSLALPQCNFPVVSLASPNVLKLAQSAIRKKILGLLDIQPCSHKKDESALINALLKRNILRHRDLHVIIFHPYRKHEPFIKRRQGHRRRWGPGSPSGMFKADRKLHLCNLNKI